MLIKKVHVQGFGALENASFSFGPGVNLIYGPNEAGKSTLQYFIYGLLYGLRKKTSSTLTDEAKLYQPWRGTQFGGSMEFSVAGEEYLLLRDFASGGAAQLFCGRTGEDLTRNFPVDPKNGELLFASELLGLSELAFRNITYIGQLASRCQGTCWGACWETRQPLYCRGRRRLPPPGSRSPHPRTGPIGNHEAFKQALGKACPQSAGA